MDWTETTSRIRKIAIRPKQKSIAEERYTRISSHDDVKSRNKSLRDNGGESAWNFLSLLILQMGEDNKQNERKEEKSAWKIRSGE